MPTVRNFGKYPIPGQAICLFFVLTESGSLGLGWGTCAPLGVVGLQRPSAASIMGNNFGMIGRATGFPLLL